MTKNKTILITGSNSGIGKLTAELFAKNNWQVIATMRDVQKAGTLASSENIHVFALDVTRLESIRQAKETIIKQFGKIDVIVNNAGFGVYGAFEEATEDEIDLQLAVNVKGLMKVTKVWLPHFRENSSGMFINISSVAGLASYPLGSLYISSKWAVEGFTEALYYEVRPFNIRLKLIEPGGFRTNFQTSSIAWTNDPKIRVYKEKTEIIRKARDERYPNMPDAIHVAEMILKAANDTSERLRYLVGEDAARMIAIREREGSDGYIQHYYRGYMNE